MGVVDTFGLGLLVMFWKSNFILGLPKHVGLDKKQHFITEFHLLNHVQIIYWEFRSLGFKHRLYLFILQCSVVCGLGCPDH